MVWPVILRPLFYGISKFRSPIFYGISKGRVSLRQGMARPSLYTGNTMHNKRDSLQNHLNIARQISYLQERLTRYSEKYTSVYQIALHMLNACLVSLRFYRKEKHTLNGPLKICVKLGGGIGDLVIRLNWVCAFYNKFASLHPMEIDVCSARKELVAAFLPLFISENLTFKQSDKRNYDLIISLDTRVPVVQYASTARLPEKLCIYIERMVTFEQKYKGLLLILPYHDSISQNILSEAKKWWQHPDILDEFHLTEAFLINVKLTEEQETLEKFHLKPATYITVNREVGDSQLVNSTKLWPLAYYRVLVEQIKINYPAYQIVEIGTGKGNRIGNAHLNLAGQTSLEEVKVILKYAALHIDSEGGLVHLRHALNGGPSLVFFGPSDPEILGYSENINLRGNGCDICCEYYSNTWQEACIKGSRKCMESLLPKEVFIQLQQSMVLKK